MSGAEGVFTVEAIAARLGARLEGRRDVAIRGVGAIESAAPDEITFVKDARYARAFAGSRAGAALVTHGLAVPFDAERQALLHVVDAEVAASAVLELFLPAPELPAEGVHEMACVNESARLGRGVRIAPQVTVDRACVLGDGVVLFPGVRLYAGVELGAGTIVHANAVVRERCRIGRDVIIGAGVVIGGEGFGFRPAPDGSGPRRVPHLGTVEIEDAVEIGPGTTIDRAKFGATRIGAGTKIDAQCIIAHNCRLGRCCILAGRASLSGSVVLGDGVVLGGGVGVSDHRTIGSGATVGAMAGVMRDIPAGEAWAGQPATTAAQALRQWSSVRKLPDLIHRIRGHSGPERAHGGSSPNDAKPMTDAD
jgi:UDP-3-O-[3-hydroxymyristoyl] glucosamine N-acyltransferase